MQNGKSLVAPKEVALCRFAALTIRRRLASRNVCVCVCVCVRSRAGSMLCARVERVNYTRTRGE